VIASPARAQDDHSPVVLTRILNWGRRGLNIKSKSKSKKHLKSYLIVPTHGMNRLKSYLVVPTHGVKCVGWQAHTGAGKICNKFVFFLHQEYLIGIN
jgi:hypothetical protein